MNHPTAEDMIRTMAFVPQSGSVVDPLVDEISWVAWRLDGYDPHGLTHESMLRVSLNFDCLVELACVARQWHGTTLSLVPPV